MTRLILFTLGAVLGFLALIVFGWLRFVLEPDYIMSYNPGYVKRNREAK